MLGWAASAVKVNVQNFRLAITDATRITLKNALTLLGIETVEQM
ncbi:MAG: hypothetical protein IJC07_03705 [Clostridia bacterium]|nr:hypothetical protein [Clostridia bacterium]